jgi:hypothetical protein
MFLLVAQGIDETERQLLLEFDALMKDFGPNPQDSVVVGMCLRRLGLYYRGRMMRYKRFSQSKSYVVRLFSCRDSPCAELDLAQINNRKEKHKAMYEALTTAYSMVYSKSSSPYSPEWCLEDHRKALGNNEHLIDLLKEVMITERNFCELRIILN